MPSFKKTQKVESLEPMVLMSASAVDIDPATLSDGTEGNDVLIALEPDQFLDGEGGHDIVIGLAGDNVLNGGSGHDMIIAVRGDNVIDGGSGQDTLVYWKGNRAEYTFADKGFGITEISNGQNTDFVTGVEEIQFNDGSFKLTDLVDGNVSAPITQPTPEPVTPATTETAPEPEAAPSEPTSEPETVEVDADYQVGEGGSIYGNASVDEVAGSTYSLKTQPTVGSLNMYGDGSFDYHAPAGFSGVVTFAYDVTGTDGSSVTKTISIIVGAGGEEVVAEEVTEPAVEEPVVETPIEETPVEEAPPEEVFIEEPAEPEGPRFGEYIPGTTHDFARHADSMYPTLLIETQEQYGGFGVVGNTIVARSPITGLQPVVEQAIEQITSNGRNKNLTGQALESKIANQITQLNDWNQLTKETQNKLIIMTGIDFRSMSKDERESTLNHLLHSPLPFGEIQEVIPTSMKIDLGYTHTLDKNKTEATALGGGLYRITMISNNNNGSHTGHNLGSFVIDLGPFGSEGIAKDVGNDMIINENNNNKLYLDKAARDILYGQVEKKSFKDVPFHGAHKGHDFVTHVQANWGHLLANGQEQYSGYAKINDNSYIARSAITGLSPVIEQAIDQVTKRNPNLTGEALEAKVANQLTQLNDWENLTQETQTKIMIMTGIDFGSMSKSEREGSINHLLHSPLPFGDLTEPLSRTAKIDLGYTHTLDKNDTMVEHLEQGLYRITMLSDNNNGSHTGHKLGSFIVDLGEMKSYDEVKKIGNSMVINTNNNNKLYLDRAAQNVLYGRTEAANGYVAYLNGGATPVMGHSHGGHGHGGASHTTMTVMGAHAHGGHGH